MSRSTPFFDARTWKQPSLLIGTPPPVTCWSASDLRRQSSATMQLEQARPRRSQTQASAIFAVSPSSASAHALATRRNREDQPAIADRIKRVGPHMFVHRRQSRIRARHKRVRRPADSVARPARRIVHRLVHMNQCVARLRLRSSSPIQPSSASARRDASGAADSAGHRPPRCRDPDNQVAHHING